MIYLLKFLLIASLLTNLVNSHGRVRSPKTRSEGQPNTDTQWCGFMHNQYYYNGILLFDSVLNNFLAVDKDIVGFFLISTSKLTNKIQLVH